MSEAASVDYKASLTRLALLALFLLVACPAVEGEVALTSTQVPFGYAVLPNVTYVRRPGWDGKLYLFVPSDRTFQRPSLFGSIAAAGRAAAKRKNCSISCPTGSG